MPRRARVAIVGAGGIAGISHMPALAAERHRTDVVAAVDVDGTRAKAFSADHGIPQAYTGRPLRQQSAGVDLRAV
ncbi:Gfo/Idh/MocA family oxidoreductase [Sphaerisporangium perillae]|uniref:Gfo/Idh/MocA family oxidoreductase n=1 Tax=Sphaerisporangium perillae TaxID=2935860 RepID=UPI00200CD20C|nr:Gfo/Idh/MocA family oxidoreductase [Sphaerisporangium perillae]